MIALSLWDASPNRQAAAHSAGNWGNIVDWPDLFLDHRIIARVQTVLVLLALACAMLWPAGRPAPLGGIERQFERLRSRIWLQAAIVALLAIGLRAALLPVLGPPVPTVTDEFSILLQAETFALGRFANPTHPFYPFFESMYVAHQPAYGSMYFPGRGLLLALPIALGAHPWLGVWLTMVLLCVASLWMLRGWVSPGLAFAGAVMIVLSYGVLSGWINSYYGPTLTALGGVLALGAFPRLMREPRWRDGFALGAGLALMMISRPFDGLMFSLPFLLVIGWKLLVMLWQRAWRPFSRIVAPVLLLTGSGAILLLAYNSATTGDPLRDPYTHNRETYAYTSAFIFGAANEPTHPVPASLELAYREETTEYLKDYANLAYLKVNRALNFYVGPVLFLPFLIGLFAARRHMVLWASLASVMGSFFLISWYWSQYIAAGFGLFLLFSLLGLSAVRRWQFRGRPAGMVLSHLLPAVVAVGLILPSVALFFDDARDRDAMNQAFVRSCCGVLTESARSRIAADLLATPGRDLVLYRSYSTRVGDYTTIVANGPEIDDQPIIWAHHLGPATQRLIDRYPDRRVWLIDERQVNRAVPIAPYPASASAGR